MLRLKIESHKKYPDTARLRYLEGRVKIHFMIAKDGRISDLKIVKPARHNSLNKAVLKAVRDSAPFPVPPSNLFKESLKIEITIVFELT
ncbi:MAG: energy transducer TonB [Deltaproteobacteria bacterium]|nr:energy transducer TonB [Deltaproteobacteria bacterium]